MGISVLVNNLYTETSSCLSRTVIMDITVKNETASEDVYI